MGDASMKAYLVESYVPDLDEAVAARTASSLCAATAELRARGVTIEFLHSFAVLGDETNFSLFSATGPADVRRAAELARVVSDHLAEVTFYSCD
ncbi:MAG: hypothetical protein H0V40_10075 [Actinobacteria bacterium]|nr:hypothetical protein [Actinomycetota bacterium]